MNVTVNNQQFTVVRHNFWENYSNWEPDTYKVFKELLRSDSVFVDIGAYIGPTMIFAAALGVKKIHAVEPNLTSFLQAQQNCEMNEVLSSKVILHRVCITIN